MKELDKAAQAAVREINRKLQSTIRNDFEFPSQYSLENIPPLEHGDPEIPASSTSGDTHASGSGSGSGSFGSAGRREEGKMRERYYGTTDDSSDEDAQMVEDIYAFDSPDTVGEVVDKKAGERRKRKRWEMEEELRYNTGLCFFQRRRNAWTGAVPFPSTAHEHEHEGEVDGEKMLKLATSSDSSPVRTPTSAVSDPTAAMAPTTIMEGVETTPAPQPPISEWIPAWHASSFEAPSNPSTLTNVLISVAPPLVPPSNPVRISLASRSHSELYTKIVRDSRTPAIPVNLADMTRIIVQGWKDEGNWPPRGTAPEASIAVRRGLGGASGNRVLKGIGTRGDGGGEGEFLRHHPHLQRGVEGVKRVFRLSGSAGSHEDGLTLKSPKSPKEKVVKGDVGSAFRSHE